MQQEVSELYSIQQWTIGEWVKKKAIEKIVINSTAWVQVKEAISLCWWLKLEQKLFKDFIVSGKEESII